MKIVKFGGSSVGSGQSIQNVLNILQNKYASGEKFIVVSSAMSGVTNILTELAQIASEGKDFKKGLIEIEQRHFTVIKEMITVKNQNPAFTQIKIFINEIEDLLQGVYSLRELSLQSKDLILSYGEKCSTFLLSQIAKQYFSESIYVDASILIKTDSNFGNARVHTPVTEHLLQEFYKEHSHQIMFFTGFIASNENNRITTLGRGGSDYTAAIIAAALDAEEIELWSDVDGMLTADPRVVKKAFSLSELSYTEAMELSYFGAKVIYPPAMIPAFRKKIPIVLKNTFNPSFKGTRIEEHTHKNAYPIRGISSIDEISLINITGSGMIGKIGFSGKLFSLLAREHINVILITQSSSEHSITFAIEPKDVHKAKQLFNSEFELELETNKLNPPIIEENLCVLAIVGENMKQTPGISGKLFQALGRNGINIHAIAQGSSEYNISVIIKRKNISKALNAVHDAFFTQLTKTLHVFSVGTGNIGATLLRQIDAQSDFLRENNGIEVKINGIANSRKMIIDEEGIDLTQWQERINKGETSNLDEFIQKIKLLNLSNCIFVDNTASPITGTYYKELFESNVSVVTCNKIANSSSYKDYKDLKDTARRRGVDFFYETNVGAGLPIIRTLKDLMTSGDRIIKIEAILSGTISYIFNNFRGKTSFYEVVKKAHELGYTEPDPREDLSGKDFMRKMMILARDAGYQIEEKDVELGAILPESCFKAPSIDDFYEELKKSDSYFNELKEKAENENKVLRYIGKLEDGKASVNLEFVDASHPFYNLTGSDNIISFTTERYKFNPLVIKGPGAGAEVTAAGVFADLINVGAN
ncbi:MULTISPECIES: bifunctional aspartate kinase/homoserine dehydrogenase I [unclassified Apibacter]|uniref:bifunctional aspartate kinase/homoserine dehydrogenase I n=1 Tax=unclassified Apibacter TaxID=2630820 RepID=UPI0013231BEB|nr:MULTISPECIES: bifunctional aspartate kinase/homoserine dehydrogenase I [unclassified Apibacter]MCX8676808.1 bifunctional aspartate kinase/homoserine dehydrogenase I [Apibacter sp. B3919]MXO24810.1 bifunctional aspartate kinase/homoserine dehydrogenase I [Apibacter sp. B3924]MXO26054.1 bifunctional aspartate kinase/homoserine dehydrogenase I [Apibacter sp. B3813]MXO28005.1 bifunctional aspartate kinase/homoserine dehydrogenase I [Apibacter sp. B3913]MXO29635.1 bifunctional aspartate kinase/h